MKKIRKENDMQFDPCIKKEKSMYEDGKLLFEIIRKLQ